MTQRPLEQLQPLSRCAGRIPRSSQPAKRIDAIFDVEREITGLTAPLCHDARQRLVRPMVEELYDWMRAERARMSKHNPVAKAINYMLDEDGRWAAFSRFLDDGRICLTNNAAEPALPCAAWPSAGRHGSSPDPLAAETAPPSCIP
jgi:hypothetical protein